MRTSISQPSLLGRLLILAILGFCLLSPARADDHSMIEQVHHDLQQALNPGGDPPDAADLTALLKSALEILKDLPPHYHGHRVTAMADIKAALDELAAGDPNHQVSVDIREADREVRDIED